MKKRTKLTTAILLAVSVNVSYGGENCLPPDVGSKQTPMDVFRCFQRVLDAQKKQIAELDAISVSSSGNVAIGTPLSSRTQIGAPTPTEKFEINGGVIIFGDVESWPTLMTINGHPKTGAMKFTTMWDGFHFDTGEAPNALYIHQDGRVGIATTDPTEKLQVNGNIKANAFKTGDIFFEKDGKTLWQMFEDEQGLYVKHIKTDKTYRLMLEEVK
ncbi:hypothetical protein [Candidatus Parabeggiatoa sp. HSG14]|uniref:hypothetical protein n=1 Tax=Candidatus Parabeggiatoa sp. HSG14 TaxID=3055593 RepID=UPI0025A88882|nr:hypothetical protein [Thiotrichales bacterium HSG14]